MPGIVLSIEAIDRTPIRGMRKQIRQLKADALQELVEFFFQKMVPARFTPGNDARYRHEKRNEIYKTQIKRKHGVAQGKYVNNRLKGASARRAMAFPRISGTSQGKRLKLETPAYFRRPFVGTFTDPQTGRKKRITRQPDKVAETVRVSDAEKAELRKKFQQILGRRLKQLTNNQRRTF